MDGQQQYSSVNNQDTPMKPANVNNYQPVPNQNYVPPMQPGMVPPQQYQPGMVNQPQYLPQPQVVAVPGAVTYSPVQNQVLPGFIDPMIVQFNLKSNPTLAVCPLCKHSGITVVTQSCSCANICCCLCTTPITWIIFQAARNKDISCNDAVHRCARCNNVIGQYQAC